MTLSQRICYVIATIVSVIVVVGTIINRTEMVGRVAEAIFYETEIP
jgi:hypothetical protein